MFGLEEKSLMTTGIPELISVMSCGRLRFFFYFISFRDIKRVGDKAASEKKKCSSRDKKLEIISKQMFHS